MTHHDRSDRHDPQHPQPGPGHDHEAELADLLELDAEVLGPYLDELTGWARAHAPDAPSTVLDLGAGTGTCSLALARRFGTAEVVAVERSVLMLDRLRARAREQGLADRLRFVHADVDVAWPAVGAVDVAWAASSLHEVADPDRVLRDLCASLNPGGLLVVVEVDALPRFLTDEGPDLTGLEARCHEALAQSGWNAHPDWGPYLERTGFEVAARRSFPIEVSSAPASIGRYAHAYLRRIRTGLDGRLATEDLAALDRLLGDDSPQAVLRRHDLTLRSSRTAWAARRP